MTPEFLTEFLTAQRLRAGPLGEHIETFAALLTDRGYASSTTMEYVRFVADAGRWLGRRQLPLSGLDEGLVARYRQHRRRCGQQVRGKGAILRLLLALLRDMGIVPPATPDGDSDASSIDRIQHAFGQYVALERGLCAASQANTIPVVRCLLSWRFGAAEPVQFGHLNAQDIGRFVVHQARRLSPGRMKLLATALRMFLHWLHQRGDTATDLAASVPSVADWRVTVLPKSIPAQQVESVLRHCDRRTPRGLRDYAILLLLARLGLRAGEVVAMELDDIDWEAGLLVIRGKGGQHDRLPLPRDVGAAVAAYLRRGRPPCSTRRVFVRAKAPLGGFTHSSAICCIVRHALTQAGLSPPRKGAHLLRHTLACTMLRRGASLTEIGQVLRHRSQDMTALYARVDLESLREVAPAWPGMGGEA
jgi:integrase/recombinase XerD